MDRSIHLKTPLTASDVAALRAGDRVILSGVLYTARDAAHRRLIDLIEAKEPLPIPLAGQVLYYVGPSPAPPGRPIGAASPTTSYRMDPYTPQLLEKGLKGIIGKGKRSEAVKQALMTYGAVYFAAIGGAGALMSQSIRKATVVAYHDLGPEAIRELYVEGMPLVVVNDTEGNDLYEEGRKAYRID